MSSCPTGVIVTDFKYDELRSKNMNNIRNYFNKTNSKFNKQVANYKNNYGKGKVRKEGESTSGYKKTS